ncbi:glycosyltransferase family 2 protein [Crossiella cryophila]|uniref:Glycosyltransferase involved in cell wall biosynthesis n=1 Tax=Crossiella cryophila TaxID=43355 RepID=A0A7W7FRY8_9PSEU|nr:glycosyltransferase family 2 protein [Crossiella cryophila]MBB4676521.1 glycosyltransferase involved in cell wall biosynthesis [Crossiella cryophila]
MGNRDYGLLPDGVKQALRRTVGRYVVAEGWWRLKFAADRTAAAKAEDSEIARLAPTLPVRPTALVTVAVPTYRRPEALGRAVRSALAQTVTDLSVIVVDDGGGELGELPADPRLTVLSLGRNHHSPGLARNVAIRLTRSPFVAFLDDDNTWRPHHLATVLPALRRGAGLVYTDLHRTRPDGSTVDILGRDFDRRAHADTAWVDVNALAVRRFPGLRFDPWARPGWVHPREDWELVHRLSARLRVEHLPEVTVDYAVHAGSYFSEWTTEALGADR